MSRVSPARRVLVVGGAGGIGTSIVQRFAEAGDAVVVLDRAPLPSALAPAVVAELAVDIADADALIAAVGETESLLGGLDVVVNAAGILRITPFAETTLEEWDLVQAVNARAAFVVVREAGRRMLAAGTAGRIVTIASMAAKAGGVDEAAYAASKAAVVALTRVAALEWGRAGITVNCVCPGYIPTAMGADTRTADDIARWESQTAVGRLGTPGDVAGVIAFLASDAAAYLTGQAINVTGGMVMH
ncbi:SDR family oxidoreductase [Herbiconiux moechotypicola]|uniref:SDR family oxidoreductase n=1 Tax=Herbiconiux moechotypicola TaxID=637393 RepID=A0ABN3DHH0_9MICO|nr:SDR family oxidoreductase [Herbiconiux moechotypicola]MCS5729632.1 SDR family oxidoreductase [Herbiconiux moechotypicola]